MSQVPLFWGGPAIAPIIGRLHLHALRLARGVLGIGADRRDAVGGNWRLLPETLKPELKQPLQFKALFQGYREVVGDRRFPAAGHRLRRAFQRHVPHHVLSAPVFLGEHLRGPHHFWFFMCSIRRDHGRRGHQR